MGGLGVEDHRLGHDQRRVAGGSGAPAEVEVVAEHRQVPVEAAELLERRTPDQQAGAVDGEHLAHLVVLALVVLTALETGLPAAGAADGDADLEQPLERGPLTELGAEEVGLGMRWRRLQQLLQRVGRRVAVVVQQPDPLGGEPVLRQGGRRERDGLGVRRTAALAQHARRDRRLGRSADSIRSALPSLLPVSTATTPATGAVCARMPSSTAGSHDAPSWLTSTTQTSDTRSEPSAGQIARRIDQRADDLAHGGRGARPPTAEPRNHPVSGGRLAFRGSSLRSSHLNQRRAVKLLFSSACGAHARTGRPRCRSARPA